MLPIEINNLNMDKIIEYKKPALRAYQLNTVNLDYKNESIQRGYVLEPIYGETEHIARKEALKICYDHGIEETWSESPLTYVNIRIKRFKECDKFIIEGKLKTRSQIEYDKRVVENKNMLNQMLIDNPNGFAYIKKGGSYYCSNFCGYTERKQNAGVYTIAQAVRECLGVSIEDYMRPEPIDIQHHNAMIIESIEVLKDKLIDTQC